MIGMFRLVWHLWVLCHSISVERITAGEHNLRNPANVFRCECKELVVTREIR